MGLKIQNAILLTDIDKYKQCENGKENVDILEMQTLRIKNEKLNKKLKIQSKKIEMYKKKMGKRKNDLSLVSIASSEGSGSSQKRKKRKFSEMTGAVLQFL